MLLKSTHVTSIFPLKPDKYMKFSHLTKMKRTIALGLVIVLPVFAQAQGLYENPLDKKLKKVLETQNAKLPTMVAPGMRQEKASVMNGVLTHTYTILSKSTQELKAMNVGERQRSSMFPGICQDPFTSRLLRDGVAFKYVYLGNDGMIAAQIFIGAEDCRGK